MVLLAETLKIWPVCILMGLRYGQGSERRVAEGEKKRKKKEKKCSTEQIYNRVALANASFESGYYL